MTAARGLRDLGAWSRAERGSAIPSVLAILVVMLLLGMADAGLMGVQMGRVRAQSAADLAALAAARVPSALMTDPPVPDIPCGLAGQVAERNAARLVDCRVDDGDIRVVVSRSAVYWGIPWTVTARARAGPPG